ncbi:MAG: hypothetical protein K2G99_05695, partial [Desulfovibrio sp.]|nr:hypothetical protein [Desulfovibrio sp.]
MALARAAALLVAALALLAPGLSVAATPQMEAAMEAAGRAPAPKAKAAREKAARPRSAKAGAAKEQARKATPANVYAG